MIYQYFLPQYTLKMIRVCTPEIGRHPWRNCNRIQVATKIYPSRLRLFGDTQGNVWVNPGGIVGATVIGERVINAWVQTKHTSARFLDSLVDPHQVFVSGWRRWGKINWEITCKESDECAEGRLQNLDWLRGEKYIGLTLDWDYQEGKVHFSMAEYVEKSLSKF